MGYRHRGAFDQPKPILKPAVVQSIIAAILLGSILLLIGTNIHFLSTSNIQEEALPGLEQPNNAVITRRRDATLVLYVYNAADTEHARNFAFFLRYGISEDGVDYRIIVTKGPGVKDFPRLPTLPANAQYLRTEQCTGTWGAIDAVMGLLPISDYKYFVVVDSSVRGPFLPPYLASSASLNEDEDIDTPLHWTEAFTNKLKDHVKLVGSTISCEGAPVNGNAAAEWRGNPAVSPHAWATDATGWALLTSQHGVFRCHSNTWEQRYHADVGASLAILKAGWTLDTLLTRYQGVDWTQAAAWQCNQRVRPDYEHHYDGISVTPYETVFVPVSESTAAAKWSFTEAADRYERWMDRLLRPADARPGVHTNQWITNHWTAKSEKLVYMNTRGPACFDFDYYVENNSDIKDIAQDELSMWEHFVLVGQFHARKHRFTCAMPTGNSYRVAYVLARGPRCFDYKFYLAEHKDLQRAGITSPQQLFEHFAEFGQFEKRRIRFTCADTMYGLRGGFDTDAVQTGDGGWESALDLAAKDAEDAAELLNRQGDADDAVQQALKGVLVSETAKDFATN
jgi:hypothetical protein